MSHDAEEIPPGSGKSPLFVPHEYQERVIQRMLEQERLGLFLDPG